MSLLRRILLGRRASGAPLLEPYRGYATPEGLVVRGRVLTGLRRTTPVPEASRLTNLLQMISLFITSEVSDIPVTAPEHGVAARSDTEGYLWFGVPRDGHEPGWSHVALQVADRPATRRAFPVLIPDPRARLGVISDIDDTVMETGSYSLLRNLWTTFTGSALTRHVYPDAVRLIARLHGGRNPVFYVSSSPWNLHHFLVRVFERAELVAGPMFLRDLGLTRTRRHVDHKGAAIDRILAANPGLPFVLVGDTGQKDAFAYRDAVRRHPSRVLGVILREPVRGADTASLAALDEIGAEGVPVHHAADFEAVPAPILAAA